MPVQRLEFVGAPVEAQLGRARRRRDDHLSDRARPPVAGIAIGDAELGRRGDGGRVAEVERGQVVAADRAREVDGALEGVGHGVVRAATGGEKQRNDEEGEREVYGVCTPIGQPPCAAIVASMRSITRGVSARTAQTR